MIFSGNYYYLCMIITIANDLNLSYAVASVYLFKIVNIDYTFIMWAKCFMYYYDNIHSSSVSVG